jgi:FkbM family methyltransferase
VSGVYIQRKPGQVIPEIYEDAPNGGTRNISWDRLQGRGLVEIAGSGFGCVLVKKRVFVDIGYPQFVYKTALDHANTVSEDTYFCMKAREKGYKLFADTSIVCDHIGSTKFVPPTLTTPAPIPQEEPIHPTLKHIQSYDRMPEKHMEYLWKMKTEQKVEPKIIYDIGACVFTWSRCAREVWPEAEYIAFEAMEESRPIFEVEGVKYHIGVLSDKDRKEVEFYQSCDSPGGNSYYRENPEHSKMADVLYKEGTAIKKTAFTLDTIVNQKGFPIPDLIKMDVQGAELDVLRGARSLLEKTKHIILELQAIDYNMGAPKKDEVINYLKEQGFELVEFFCDNGADGDYHFVNTKL